jgi:PAS domain-containing protein
MKHKEFQLAMDPLNELEKSRIAYSLKIIISVSVVLLSILSVARLLLRPAPNISDYLLWMMTGIIIIISIFSKRDKNRYAGLLYVVITWIPLTLLAWTHVGVKDIAVVGYIVCILFAMNITLYWQANTVFLFSIISIWGLLYAEYNHIIIPTEESSITYTIEYSVILCLVMVLLNINRRNQLFYYKSLQKEFNEKITAERSLHESESLIKSISNKLSMGMIYQVVRQPDGTSRFTYLSNSVRDFYGISPEEGIADASLIYKRIHKDDIDPLVVAENEAVATLSILKKEVRIHDPSGKIRWSSLVSTPRKQEDGSVCFDGIEFDITESKKNEERERTNYYNLEYISQSSLALVNMTLDENIYHAIGEKLGKLLPDDSIVILREFDPIINLFKTKFITM